MTLRFEGNWVNQQTQVRYRIIGPHDGDEYLVEKEFSSGNMEYENIHIFITGNGTSDAFIPESKFFGSRTHIIISDSNCFIIREERFNKINPIL